MEQIIEIFADAISSFILKSITLQEENAVPQIELRKNADVVVETSRTLVQITREVASSDYASFPEIQQPILDCARNVERAVDNLIETIGILFKETDRARGWRKLVDSTKTIGEQTSRLLVTIYGAEEKRLRRAAEAALAALRKVRAHATLKPEELRAILKQMADDTGDASSKVVQFNTFVGGRSNVETDGDLKGKLRRAFDDINRENQALINDANGVLTSPGEERPRKAFVGTTDKLIDLINEVLGNVKRPEDMDVYKIIEDLFGSGNKALLTQARGIDQLRDKGPYSKRDLEEMGRKVIAAMEEVKKHPHLNVEDVINNSSIGSARIAGFSEMVTVFAYQPENSVLQPKLLSSSDALNRENGNVVGDTNDYLKTQSAGSALKSGGELDRELAAVKNAIKDAVSGAGEFARAPGTSDFVPAAKKLTEAVKDILGGVNRMTEKVNDPKKTRELSEKGQEAKKAITDLINAGKALNADSNDERAKQALKVAVGGLKGSIQGLLGEATAVNQAASVNTAAPSRSGTVNAESKALTGSADRVIAIVKDVLDEINPKTNARDLIGKATKMRPEDIDRALLQRLADDALRALEQLKGYPRYTPKETLQALEYAVEAVDLFADRLGTKADSFPLQKLRDTLKKHVANINGGNDKMITACEDYIADPNAKNDKKLLGDINYLQDEIRAAMKELSPGDIGGNRQKGKYYNNVDPNDLKNLGEQIKKSDAEIRRGITEMMPKEMAKEADDNVNRGDKFTDMVESLAQQSRNPGFKNTLNSLADKLRPAVDALADKANKHLEDTSNKRAQDGLREATKDLDKLVDEVLAAIMPKAEAPQGRSQGQLSPEELARMAEQVKKAADEVKRDYKTNAPVETVEQAQDTAQRAADFGEAVKDLAGRHPDAGFKREVQDAAKQLDAAKDDLIARTNEHLSKPGDARAGRALEDQTEALKKKVDDIMDKILPTAAHPARQTHRGKVTPKDIEREARDGQDKLKESDKFEQKAPKAIVADAERTGDQVEKVRAMLDAMSDQQDRSGPKRLIRDLADKLEDKNKKLTDDTNKYLKNPADSRARRELHDQNKDVDAFLEEIIKAVKPKVEMANYEHRGDFVTPQALADAAEEARRAIKKVKADHTKLPNEGQEADTKDANFKTDKFTKLCGERAKVDKRPKVAQTLKEAVPKLEKGNKAMVDSSNDHMADPTPAASKEVHRTCQELLDLIDHVMDAVKPEAKLTTADDLRGQNFGGLTNEQLKASYDAVRAAVVKTKTEFPTHEPKQTADNSTKASRLVAVFAEQLRARSKEDPVRKMAEKLLRACEDLHEENAELNRSTNAFLSDPDDPRTGGELDGACQALLDTLDGIWGEIAAHANKRGPMEGARRNVTPATLAEMGERVKKACSELQGFKGFTPKEVAAAAEKESELASTFAEMVDEFGNQVPQDKLKKFLKDASKRVDRKNDDILDTANKHIGDRQDKRKGDALDTNCEDMKKLVDEILGQVKPKINKAEFGGDPKAGIKEAVDAARKLIKDANTTKNFDKDAPTTVAENVGTTSRDAANLGDILNKIRETTPNESLKRELGKATNDLPPGNDRLVDAGTLYIDDNKRGARPLDDSLENLKRIAEDVLRQLAPELETPNFDNTVPRDVTMAELRRAYEKAKDSLGKQQEFDRLTPSETAQRTKDAGEDVNKFRNLAKGRANGLEDPAKQREAQDLASALDQDNRGLFPATNKYFQDPSAQTKGNLNRQGGKVDKGLDDLFSLLKPRAVYSKPDFNQKQRPVSEEEIQRAANTTKDKLNDVKGFAQAGDDANAENTTQTSARMAKFTELVYLKATDKDMPAVSGTKLREVSRDLVEKNKKLVDAVNGYLDKPEDPDAASNVRNAARQAEHAIDKATQAVTDATSALKGFEELIDHASRAIRDAASAWDADDEIVAAALRIAEEMRKLAQAARDQDRKAIILHSRNIAALVKSDIVQYADKIRERCGDEATRKDISTGTTALSSFSVQLKIIASVKAAELGVGKDKTAENQLVACCQGISTSMRGTLKSTQSAKVRAAGK